MKVTKKQFKLFRKTFKRYARKFGLHEWELRFFLEDIDGGLAGILPDYEGRTCKVVLVKKWKDLLPLNDKQIRETAKHEAIELLVSDSLTMATARYTTKEEVAVTWESLVRRLEKAIK